MPTARQKHQWQGTSSETEQADLPNIMQQISGELGISGGQTPKTTLSQVHTLINTQLKGT